MATNNISIRLFDPTYKSVLEAFSLPSEQAQYTKMPIEVINETEKHDRDNLMMILDGTRPVGFFILKYQDDTLNEYKDSEAVLLSAFSVDSNEQGKGYAKSGLLLLKSYMIEHFPDIKYIVLAVNSKNIPAQSLYKKVGFKDTHRTKLGTIGEQKIYDLKI